MGSIPGLGRSHMHGAIKTILSLHSRAVTPDLVCCSCWNLHTHILRWEATSPQLEKACTQQQRPSTAKKTNAAWYWQRKRHESVEKNRAPRNKSTHLQSLNLPQRRQEYAIGKTWPLRQVVVIRWTATCKSMKWEHMLSPHTSCVPMADSCWGLTENNKIL